MCLAFAGSVLYSHYFPVWYPAAQGGCLVPHLRQISSLPLRSNGDQATELTELIGLELLLRFLHSVRCSFQYQPS